jgi:hypothetical protein
MLGLSNASGMFDIAGTMWAGDGGEGLGCNCQVSLDWFAKQPQFLCFVQKNFAHKIANCQNFAKRDG